MSCCKLFVAIAIMGQWLCVQAQAERCGTPSMDSLQQADLDFALMAQRYAQKTSGGVRIIPVAVTVVFANTNDPNNISDAQIESQIAILNNDYRGLSGGVDTDIEFCLAGINRIQHPTLSDVQHDGIQDVALKGLIQEDPNLFLNCWVVNSINGGGTLGFASFSKDFAAVPTLDGVVIADQAFGDIGTAAGNSPFHRGRTATHEIGHWLNLFHVFQGGCDDNWTCATEGDCCCDTPPQFAELFGCRTRKNTCHGDTPDENDPISNYMGYADDDCMDQFTECQRGRMLLALDQHRPNAWFTTGDCPQLRSSTPLGELSRPTNQAMVGPNPFQSKTSIRLRVVSKGTLVSIAVHNAQGQLI